MKRFLFSSIALLGCFFTFVNLTTIDQISSFVMTTVNESPVLPEEPLPYDDVEFPDHLISFDPGDDIGYGAGGVDTTAFNSITNDGATLGRVLFYDKRLSALENISCGSCHKQSLSFAENKAFSEGISAPTKRNSMQLNDMAWTNNESFFWDMSETDLHTMIRLPLTDDNEIGADINDIIIKFNETDYYPELFEKAFGDPSITEDRVVNALVQFIKSMNTFNSRFDQQAAIDFSGFTAQEHFGKELFAMNCTSCHSQGKHGSEDFGIPIGLDEPVLHFFPFFFNNGLPVDLDDRGAGEWDEGFDNLFKVPTLRNIELTAPYMHDGRFETLEEVIDFYADDTSQDPEWDVGLIPQGGYGFNSDERSALVAFLKTLTDASFLTNEKWSDPFAATTTNITTLQFNDLVIKPNPMHNVAAIEFENNQNQLVSVNIFSADGQLIKHDNINDDQYLLDKKDFGKGMYFIELIMGDRKSTQKLIVQ